MTDRSRLDLLREAGMAAWQGLKAVVTGVDVVMESEPESEPGTGAGAATGAGTGTGTGAGAVTGAGTVAGAGTGAGTGTEPRTQVDSPQPQPQAEPIGTAIGRRAMAAAEHRVGAASVGAVGSAVTAGELLAAVPLTLAVYPGPAVPLLVSALALMAEPLPEDGDLEVAATGRDLAWLPLGLGRQYYERLPGGRLLATGGYRRAALVRLEAGPGAWPGTWCALGDDGLAAGMQHPPELVQERSEALWRAMAQGKVRQALLGGELLARALALPGAAVLLALVPGAGLEMLPIWGLFSSGRTPTFNGVANEHLVVTPADAERNQDDF